MSCLTDLPDECNAHILSLTSVSDVLRSSAVSKQLLSVCESDTVWEKLLPSDLDDILVQSSTPNLVQQFILKKNLFLHLCRFPVLLKTDTQSFSLNKQSGKKCYMIGARDLTIAWGDTPQYWSWKVVPESRFPETAVLQDVCWLDISGKFHVKFLSPNTTYGAYFVFKMDVNNHRGFDNTPMNVFISETDEHGLSRQCDIVVFKRFYLKAPTVRRRSRKPKELPTEREDGWMEVEMGRYHHIGVDEGAHEGMAVLMTLRQIDELHWKSGLVVQGIELRPLDGLMQ
ncbi:putative F-box protein PP2-B12 isoform X2 [Beta vulgaris subsp. vulgaris]|uniref:putative F-box protein PP2-B12 isoform X2 n=1 Tax=Beta vulgaris subsp. vulgaris TaxID=3555 RepID=UPI0020373F7C|nr:putative F-box protein PP2-B12 isoform X2 [Beta vulgaris subsp. vulgaris]